MSVKLITNKHFHDFIFFPDPRSGRWQTNLQALSAKLGLPVEAEFIFVQLLFFTS